jgi:ABC-type nitrate/sulfonate/bicarbonate transport system permease component
MSPKGLFFLAFKDLKILRIVLFFLLFLGFLGLWEYVITTNEIPQRILPAPSSIAEYIYKEFFTPHRDSYTSLLAKTFQSFTDALIGFILSLILGTLIGIIFSKFNLIKISFSPILFASQLIPVPAFAPIIAAIMGYGVETKIFLVILFTIFPVIVAVNDAINNIPKNYLDLLKTFNANRKETFLNLILPSLVPNILHTMKILAVASFVTSILAELPLTISKGIGKDIYTSFNNQLVPRVWTSVLLISIVSLGFFLIVAYLEKFINNKYKYGQFKE